MRITKVSGAGQPPQYRRPLLLAFIPRNSIRERIALCNHRDVGPSSGRTRAYRAALQDPVVVRVDTGEQLVYGAMEHLGELDEGTDFKVGVAVILPVLPVRHLGLRDAKQFGVRLLRLETRRRPQPLDVLPQRHCQESPAIPVVPVCVVEPSHSRDTAPAADCAGMPAVTRSQVRDSTRRPETYPPFVDLDVCGSKSEQPGTSVCRRKKITRDEWSGEFHHVLACSTLSNGRIPDFPVTRSHPPASWPSAANSSICRTYRKTAGEESRRRSPVANRWMRP